MKAIGNSKVPYFHQLDFMSQNLRKKLDKSTYVKVESVTYRHSKEVKNTFSISLVPGFEEECTIFRFDSWNDLLKKYRQLMKG